MKKSRDIFSRLFFVVTLLISLMTSPILAETLPKADRLVVEKAKRTMTLYRSGKVVKTYKIALGQNAIGHKEKEGDGKTPEGVYKISGRNPQSRYHRSLRISYPNEIDRAQAKKLGVSPGGDIMIHGLPNGSGTLGAAHLLSDWTIGCIAVTNEEIEELWASVADGTPIEILP